MLLIPRNIEEELSKLDPTELQAMQNAAHARWNPPSIWIIIFVLFLAFLWNLLKPLLFPDFHWHEHLPNYLFTWIGPGEKEKEQEVKEQEVKEQEVNQMEYEEIFAKWDAFHESLRRERPELSGALV